MAKGNHGRQSHEWPAEMTDQLRALVKQRQTSGEIAGTLKVSRAAVIGKCDRLGLKLAGSTPQHQAEGSKRRGVPRDTQSAAQRPLWNLPSPPRRFSWQEPVDTPVEHA